MTHKSSISDSLRKKPSHLHFTFSPPSTHRASTCELMSLWDNLHYIKPCFSTIQRFPLNIITGSWRHCNTMQGSADVNREAFEEAESRPPQFHPSTRADPNSHCTSLFPGNQLLDWIEGRRWYSISGLWITVPCSVFFLWWFGCLTGWVAGRRRNVLLSGPQHWGTDWKTWTGGCWVITWPRGCLFKPKSCLGYCIVIVLQLH